MTAREERVALLALIDAITGRALVPGERLPRSPDPARSLGTSLIATRKAVRGLSRRGLLSLTSARGVVVRPRDDWDVLDPDVLAALLSGASRARVLREYLEARKLVERYGARLAAEHGDDEDVERIARAFGQMKLTAGRAFNDDAWEAHYQRADIAFHRAIARASGNRVLVSGMEPMLRALTVTLPVHARPAARFERSLPEHERILAAVVCGDADEAGAAMGDDLHTVERYLAELS
jgi:DNA-binding FadR family transcriptional regulator